MQKITPNIVQGIVNSDLKCFRSLYDAYYAWPFDQKFYLKLNLAIGGSWGGKVAAGFKEETYEIDWVRVYQK